MNGSERRKAILERLSLSRGVSARELAEHFCVSRMTINRDLRRLETELAVQRIHGGVFIVGEQAAPLCANCARAVVFHHAVRLPLADGQQRIFCCGHCGLRQCGPDSLERLLVTDFISGQLLPAGRAYFLLNSLVSICCCPSVLAFADQAEVSNFRLGFGGAIARLPEALDFLALEQRLAVQSLDR